MSEQQSLHSPFTHYCGIDIVSMVDGVAKLRVELQSQLLNSAGMAHGGVLATLADSAGGAAAYSVVETGKMAVTTDFNLTCLKSTFSGVIEATGTVVHRGRRFMRAQVDMVSGGQLVATAGVSFMVIDRPDN